MRKSVKKWLVWVTLILVGLPILIAGGIVSLLYFYQDKVVTVILNEANKYLSVPVTAQKVELTFFSTFPHTAITLYKPVVLSSYNKAKDTLAAFDRFYCTFNAKELWNGKYQLTRVVAEGGFVHLKTSETGLVNWDILQAPQAIQNQSQTPFSFDLKEVRFKETSFLWDQRQLQQLYRLYGKNIDFALKGTNNHYALNLTTNAIFEKAEVKGVQYLRDMPLSFSGGLNLDLIAKTLHLAPTDLSIHDAQLSMQGDLNYSNEVPNVRFSVKAQEANIETFAALLPADLAQWLRQYQSSGRLYFETKINGEVGERATPTILVTFGCRQTRLQHKETGMSFTNLDFSGRFTNGSSRNLKTAVFELLNLKGYLNGKPFSGNFLVENFEQPWLTTNLNFETRLQDLKEAGISLSLNKPVGELKGAIELEGLVKDLKAKNRGSKVIFKSLLNLEQVGWQTSGKLPQCQKIKALIEVDNEGLKIKNATGLIMGEAFELNLTAGSVFEMVEGRFSQAIQAKFKTGHIDIDKWFPVTDTSANQGTLKLPPFDFQYEIASLKWGNFVTREMKGQAQLEGRVFRLDNFKTRLAGGAISGELKASFNKGYTLMEFPKYSFEQVAVDSLFLLFNDFEQSNLTHQNLKGRLTATGNGSFKLPVKAPIDFNTLKTDFQATISQGRLVGFEPFQAMGNFFNRHDLADLKFNNLKNRISIADGIIAIPVMDIVSQLMTVRLEGTHTFENEMNYRIRVPLTALRGKDSDEKFGEIYRDESRDGYLHLTLKGKPKGIQIAIDRQATKSRIKEGLKKEVQELKDLLKPEPKKKKEIPTPADKPKPQGKEDEYLDL